MTENAKKFMTMIGGSGTIRIAHFGHTNDPSWVEGVYHPDHCAEIVPQTEEGFQSGVASHVTPR